MRYLANDEFLAHYGVQGMKWGVRRERLARARDAYTLGRGDTKLSRKLSRVESKINKRAGKGKDVVDLEVKKDRLISTQKKIQALMKTKMKDLTPTELKKGAAQAIVGRMMKSAAIGGLSVATLATGGMVGLGYALVNAGNIGISIGAFAGAGGLTGFGVGTTLGGTTSLIRSARRS